VLDNPGNIVFATCNDKWEVPNGLVRRCDVVSFSLGVRSRKAKLRDIADAEDLDLDSDVIASFAERPDLRSAINDLQVFAEQGDIPDDAREWEVSEFDAVDNMMTGSAERGEMPPSDVVFWMDENISKDWRGLELAWGYEALSRADTAMMLDKRATEAILDTLPDLRITEPYYDDGIGRKKEFPEWFRHSQPNPTGGSDEACLYRALKNYESGEPGLMGSFALFREHTLPRLQALDQTEKHELILEHRLSPDEYAALDVTEAQHTDWLETDAPEQGDGLQKTDSAAMW
jgi:replication factor C large subunit